MNTYVNRDVEANLNLQSHIMEVNRELQEAFAAMTNNMNMVIDQLNKHREVFERVSKLEPLLTNLAAALAEGQTSEEFKIAISELREHLKEPVKETT